MQAQVPSCTQQAPDYFCVLLAEEQEPKPHRDPFKPSSMTYGERDPLSRRKIRRERDFYLNRDCLRVSNVAKRPLSDEPQGQPLLRRARVEHSNSTKRPPSDELQGQPLLRRARVEHSEGACVPSVATIDAALVRAWTDGVLIPMGQNRVINNYFRNQLGYSLPSREELQTMDCHTVLRTFRELATIITAANTKIPEDLKQVSFPRLLLHPYRTLRNQEFCQAWIDDHAEAVHVVASRRLGAMIAGSL